MKKFKLFMLFLLVVVFFPWPTTYKTYRYVDRSCSIKYGIEHNYKGFDGWERVELNAVTKAEAEKMRKLLDGYSPLAWVLYKYLQQPKASRITADQMEKIPIEQLVTKLKSEIWQERIDAAYVAGVKRSKELEIKHIPFLLQGILDSRESLAFQCAYALERMGKKARCALPVLDEIEPEFRKKFANDIIIEAISSIISGISAEDVMYNPNVFQIVSLNKTGDEVILRQGFLSGKVLQVKIPDHYVNRRQLKPFVWIFIEEKNGELEISLLEN